MVASFHKLFQNPAPTMQAPSSENNHTNHEEGDMCRVCRSSESTGNNRLFHPCKCSGSMKFVHQQCLEDWLRHSGKESCDICKHVFKFQPIYDPTQPRRFSLGWSVWLILKQITKSVLGYCWAMFALFCWLVWVPFITSLTWRVFMAHKDYNPIMVATARQPKFSMLLVELFDITSIKVVQFMQSVEMSRNWPRLIRIFLTDVFEGQIICSLIVVFGMFLLLLREHLLMNMEEDDEPIAVERPAHAQPPAHAVPPNDGLLAPLPDDDTFFEYDDPQDLFMQRENLAETLQMRLDMNGGQGMNQADFEHNIFRPEPIRPVGMQPRPRDGHDAVRNIQALLAEDPNELERFLLEAADRADPNPPNPAVLPAANNNEAVDDFDPRGFLDLVGVRGPAKHLLQNLVLVHAVIVLCLTLGIWLPNVIGKYASYFTVHLLWPTLQKWNDDGIIFLQKLTDPFVEPIVDYLANYLKNSTITPASTPEISVTLPLNHTNSFVTVLKAMLFGIEQTNLHETNTKSVTSHTFFEFLKKDLSNVLSGYVAIGILLVVYVNLATMVRNRYLSAFTRICSRTVNYMLKGLKLLTFFVAELGLFPLYCGLLVDYWVFPLISTISFEERVNIFQYHPWIFVILHWIIGTTFMYHFAMYIGFVRESIRPGVLWFIRDPNDPDINIVREVLSRPFFSQIRKLVFAIALYGIVISGVLGGAVGIVRASDALAVKKFGHQTLFKIMPLRYQYQY